jgi:hypothetical protein
LQKFLKTPNSPMLHVKHKFSIFSKSIFIVALMLWFYVSLGILQTNTKKSKSIKEKIQLSN